MLKQSSHTGIFGTSRVIQKLILPNLLLIYVIMSTYHLPYHVDNTGGSIFMLLTSVCRSLQSL